MVTEKVFLYKILIFPIKSFDPIEVEKVKITPGGTLENDRRYAFFQKIKKGNKIHYRVISRKWETKLYLIRSSFDLRNHNVIISYQGIEKGFSLKKDKKALEKFISEILGYEVELREDATKGFPDDTYYYGPTITTTSTVREVGNWFNIPEKEMRLRLRTNLELNNEESSLPAFWEDRLFSKEGKWIKFKIGEVQIWGGNPCQRCPIPMRDPYTGKPLENFRKHFEEMRRKTLPPWAEKSRFNHFYRLTVNTIIPLSEAGKELRVGDIIHLNL
jgi:uncharacterized protein YcbX